jgi:hypothetical protein
MPGQNLRLSPLELQKRLLVAESELNRAQMMRDLHDFKGGVLLLGEEVKKLGSIAKSFGGIASTAAAVVAGLSAFRSRHSAVGVTKTSWLQLLLRNAGLLSSLWLALRTPKRKQLTRV